MNKHHPNKRQLLADLLAGSPVAKATLQAQRKPIVHLGVMLLTDQPQEPLPDESFAASIHYRDGRYESRALTYQDYQALESQAQTTTLMIIR
jgi:hypothetical protein